MRTALLAILLAFATPSVRAATAYEALRILGKQRGEGLLDKVTEVRGQNGAPQPRSWKIVVNDSKSRSGAREFDVQGTRLAGEKSADSRAEGSLLNMSQLNLDSDGAHQIAEREAKKVGFAYDHADYTLRAGTRGGSPIWEIRLVDDRSRSAATLNLAATTGKILGTEGLVRHPREIVRTPPPQEPPAYQPPVYRPPVVAERRPRPDERYEEDPRQRDDGDSSAPLGERVNKFFDRVGRHFDRRGQQIGDTFHNLFSSDKRHTAGPHGGSGEEDVRDVRDVRPPRRNSIDEDYTRPSRVRD